MAFPSPAGDYVEKELSLDEHLISHRAATYFMRASETSYKAGVMSGALLIVDRSLQPCDGSLLVCAMDGEFRIKRYRKHPDPHLESVDTGRKEPVPESDDSYGCSSPIFGVITYIINDARSGEFDDCPVM